jgi:hypothetical protein
MLADDRFWGGRRQPARFSVKKASMVSNGMTSTRS